MNPNNPAYRNYGGRGITVCKRWLGPKGFKNFVADMGVRSPGMSIDRKNNDIGYKPSNCRWASPKQQRANMRTLPRGRTLDMVRWIFLEV